MTENKNSDLHNHDPRYIGPGIWLSIHMFAHRARNQRNKKSFCFFIDLMAHSFPCHECKEHFQKYVEKNPPEAFLDHSYSMLSWSWRFHNGVNKRIGKKELLFQDVYNYHIDLELNNIQGCPTGTDCEDEATILVKNTKSSPSDKINQIYKEKSKISLNNERVKKMTRKKI